MHRREIDMLMFVVARVVVISESLRRLKRGFRIFNDDM